MFGYLKPFKDELKYKHMKEYKQYYCGVCNGLKKEFGRVYSVFLNYEMVYLYLFIDGIVERNQTQQYILSCYFNPFYKNRVNIDINLLEYICFINYYLATEKIRDNYLDEKNILYKWLYRFLTSRKKYKTKSLKYSEVKNHLDREMEVFYRLETEQGIYFDELASSIGRILEIIVMFYLDNENIGAVEERKLAGKLSFQLGEYIYLLDALEDYEEDLQTKKFNPLFSDISICEDKNKKVGLERGILIANLMIQKIKSLNQEMNYYFHGSILTNILEISLENVLKQIVKKNLKSLEVSENESIT